MPAFTPPNPLPYLPKGMVLWVPEGASADLIQAMFATTDMFVRMCSILTIEDLVEKCQPTPAQMVVLKAVHEHRHLWFDKYRQAFVTTVLDLIMLRDIMYGEGLQGAIVAQKEDTHKEHMRRIAFAYNRLASDPETAALVVPLKEGTKATVTGIEFEHGGGIYPLTAGSDSPGVGRSFSRVLETEACEMSDEDFIKLNNKFYPTIEKRPNGRIWRESTPGRRNGPMFRAWANACAGDSSMFPVFLPWWLDRWNTIPQASRFSPLTDEEKELFHRLPGITVEHIYFRRLNIIDRCDNDPALFDTKYPPGPLEGWASTSGTHLDGVKLRELQAVGVNDPEEHECGARVITTPNARRYYLMTADPADFGAVGDNSAFTVWDLFAGEEVAFWEGREPPNAFYDRCKKVCNYFNQAVLMLESNCSAAIGIAFVDEADDAVPLYADRNDKPGWRATTKSIQEAEGATNTLLKEDSLLVRAKSTIAQMLVFDGQPRNRRVRTKKGEQSHGDRARTVIMAASYLKDGGFTPELTDEEVTRRADQIRLQALMEKRAAEHKALRAFGITPPGAYDGNNPWEPGYGRRWQ